MAGSHGLALVLQARQALSMVLEQDLEVDAEVEQALGGLRLKQQLDHGLRSRIRLVIAIVPCPRLAVMGAGITRTGLAHLVA